MDVIWQGSERRKLSSKLLHTWRPHSTACGRTSAETYLWHLQLLSMFFGVCNPHHPLRLVVFLYPVLNYSIISLFWAKFLFTFLEKAANDLNQINPTFVNCCATAEGLIAHCLFSCCLLFLGGTWQHLSIQLTYTQDARITDNSNSEYTKKWYLWQPKSLTKLKWGST